MTSNSCIKNLPNELLAKIFSAVGNGFQDLRELPSPALLSSVCRHWQMLAQNTPELWVNIIVPLHKSPEDCKRWTTDWIARSGVLLISVMINDTTGKWTRIKPNLTNIMDLLSQYSERIHRLTLLNIYSALIESALARLQSARNLQELTICSDNSSLSCIQVGGRSSQRQYSLDFPKLTVLKAQGLMVPSISNLTSLTIRKLYESYHAISQIFTTSPGLKHLTLHDLLPLVTPLPQTALIRADSLGSLAVSLNWSQPSGQVANYIFKYLVMPNIKYLELDGDTWKTSDFGQSLSSAQIDTLRISNRSEKSSKVDTIDFLHSFSTVQHLQLVHASTRGLLSKSAQGLAGKISINFGDSDLGPTNLYIMNTIQQKQPVSAIAWPELRIITLDTLTAGEVVHLYEFVACHKHIQVVELSTSARHHLSSSLRRKDETVYQRPSLFKAAGSEEGLNDVEEWLGKMVDIRVLRSPSVGLLDTD